MLCTPLRNARVLRELKTLQRKWLLACVRGAGIWVKFLILRNSAMMRKLLDVIPILLIYRATPSQEERPLLTIPLPSILPGSRRARGRGWIFLWSSTFLHHKSYFTEHSWQALYMFTWGLCEDSRGEMLCGKGQSYLLRIYKIGKHKSGERKPSYHLEIMMGKHFCIFLQGLSPSSIPPPHSFLPSSLPSSPHPLSFLESKSHHVV